MKHTISILVNNHPGVMSHVSGLFTRRAYNIDSIAVGVTDNPEVSSMTIVLKGDENTVAQVTQQLLKLPDVLKVTDLSRIESVTRELVLIQVRTDDRSRPEITGICDVFKAKIVDASERSMIVEYSGNSRQVSSLISMLKKYGITEIARTGAIAIKIEND